LAILVHCDMPRIGTWPQGQHRHAVFQGVYACIKHDMPGCPAPHNCAISVAKNNAMETVLDWPAYVYLNLPPDWTQPVQPVGLLALRFQNGPGKKAGWEVAISVCITEGCVRWAFV